jgi:hypothetical protein
MLAVNEQCAAWHEPLARRILYPHPIKWPYGGQASVSVALLDPLSKSSH